MISQIHLLIKLPIILPVEASPVYLKGKGCGKTTSNERLLMAPSHWIETRYHS
jgi:hypothetical protein